MSDYLWKALLVEFLGTFTLVFVGCSAVALTAQQGGSLVGSAFAFGLALMAIIYAWGSYSGAHVNPAVSFGFAVAGRMNWGLMLGYWIAQLLGGILAAALIAYIFGTASGVGASIGSLTNTDAWKAVLLEAILTFFLVVTILLVTRNPMLAVASGLAIGLVLTFDMLAGAPLTGASMNPARSLGPAIFSNNLGTYWIYVVGPLLGALVAALVYKLFTVDFTCCDKVDECGKPILDQCGRKLKECKRCVVDNCGNSVKDCNGKPLMESYTKHERLLSHHQETPLLYMGEWMSAHGFDPRYLQQEIGHAIEKSSSSGMLIEDPKSMIDKSLSPSNLNDLPQAASQTLSPVVGQTSGQAVSSALSPSQLMSAPQSLATLAPL
jgi:MIP family channel proteins